MNPPELAPLDALPAQVPEHELGAERFGPCNVQADGGQDLALRQALEVRVVGVQVIVYQVQAQKKQGSS